MKKTLALIVMILSTLTVGAQKTVQGSGFLDDWSVSAMAGTVTPAAHAAFFGGMRPTYGLEMTKYIVPEFGMGAQILAAHNTTASSTMLDGTQLLLLGNVHLSNLFASYLGRPRSFELIAVFGAGWGHHYYPAAQSKDYNFMATKWGLQFKFFVDRQHYAWSVDVKPSLVYNMDNGHSQPTFNINKGAWELLVGLTYHFKNGNNGQHHFTALRPYDRTEVEALNAKINGLHQMVSERDKALKQAEAEIDRLKKQLPAR